MSEGYWLAGNLVILTKGFVFFFCLYLLELISGEYVTVGYDRFELCVYHDPSLSHLTFTMKSSVCDAAFVKNNACPYMANFNLDNT